MILLKYYVILKIVIVRYQTFIRIILAYLSIYVNNNIIVEAKVIQIKEDEQTNEKMYYVHFLNFEKRMDKWVPLSSINKNLGKKTNTIEGVSYILYYNIL